MKSMFISSVLLALVFGAEAYDWGGSSGRSSYNNARSSAAGAYGAYGANNGYTYRTQEEELNQGVVGFVYNEDAACGYPFAEFFITEIRCEEDQSGTIEIDGEQVQADYQSYSQKYGSQYAEEKQEQDEQENRRDDNQCYLGDRMQISGTVNLTESLYRRFDVELTFCYKNTDWSWKSTQCSTYKAPNLNIGGNYYDAKDEDGNVQNYWSQGWNSDQQQQYSKQEWYAEQYQKCQQQQWDGNGNDPCDYDPYNANEYYNERADAGLYLQPGEHDWSTVVTVPAPTSKKALKAGTVVTATMTITPKKQYSKKAYKQSMYRKNNNMEFSLYHTKCKATFNAGFDQAWYDEESERYREEYKEQNWKYYESKYGYAAACVGVASLTSMGAYVYFGRKRRSISSVSQEAIHDPSSRCPPEGSISDSYTPAVTL